MSITYFMWTEIIRFFFFLIFFQSRNCYIDGTCFYFVDDVTVKYIKKHN